MSSRCGLIIDHIEELIKYLQPLLPLANFHMVDYFSVDVFRTFFSHDLLEEIFKIGVTETINIIFSGEYSDVPHLKHYLETSKKFALCSCPGICLSTKDFYEKLVDWNCEQALRLKLNAFMNSKKSHEVDVMSYFCAAIKNVSSTSHLIDIGDGKGYLSSMLALHHGIPVLGIDASHVNTDGSVKRVQKLSKHLNSILKPEDKNKKISTDFYKQITKFVDKDIDLGSLVSNIFLEKPQGLGLVGLHTCGNLAADSIRIFIANDEIKTICNVGCCYHFITEEFDTEHVKCNKNYGFPLSQYLKSKKILIGRAARMISAQPVERILKKKELPNKTLFYRSLFEVLLNSKPYNVPKNCRQVGRFRKPVSDFVLYVQKASDRIKLDVVINEDEIIQLHDEYKHKEPELYLFYLLRNMLAPTIESLILLDRLLYLHETGYEKSYLVQLFDPVISPRCYGIIAIK